MLGSAGRSILFLGLSLVVVGAGFVALDNLGVHRVTGDLVWRRGGVTVIAPIGVMALGSLLLTIILNLIVRGR